MTTPIPRILAAVDARIEFVRLTHPFGGGGKPRGRSGGGKAPTAPATWPPPATHRDQVARDFGAALDLLSG